MAKRAPRNFAVASAPRNFAVASAGGISVLLIDTGSQLPWRRVEEPCLPPGALGALLAADYAFAIEGDDLVVVKSRGRLVPLKLGAG